MSMDRKFESALFTGSLDRNSNNSDNDADDGANDSDDGRVLLHVSEPCLCLITRSHGMVGTQDCCLIVERMNAESRRLSEVAWR